MQNKRRLVPVPRRALRWLAGSGTRVLTSTAIGHALRLLYYRNGKVEGRGRCKASWVAELFGVDERGVRRARKKLLELGLLERAEADSPAEQVFENRWGRAFRWNLAWSRDSEPSEADASRLPPPEAFSTSCLPPPESDRKPLRESKNQKPGSGTPGASSEQRKEPPKLYDVQLEDLKDTKRLLELFEQAKRKKLVGESEGARLNFVGAAEHALSYGQRPEALFSHLLRRGLWSFITHDDEDAASRRIKEAVFGSGAACAKAKREPVSGVETSDGPCVVGDLLAQVMGAAQPRSATLER